MATMIVVLAQSSSRTEAEMCSWAESGWLQLLLKLAALLEKCVKPKQTPKKNPTKTNKATKKNPTYVKSLLEQPNLLIFQR